MKRLYIIIALGLVLWLSIMLSDAAAQPCRDTIVTSTPASNFILHEDGTVSHKTTGLMWMRCSLGQSWTGKSCSGAAVQLPWQGALQSAAAHEYAGYSDWRLPDKNELESILEERCNSPAIDLTVFPGTPSSYFWSSSPYAGLSHGAWSIDFGYGSVNATVKSGKIHTRLVRGGE